MENQQYQSQSNLQQEITKHLCQAHAVQIKGLQNSLGEIINQTTKALDEGQPELAANLWKQVVQTTQNISRLFNQTTAIMYETAVPGVGYAFQQGRRFSGQQGNGGRHRNRNKGNNNPTAKQLNRLARKVDELVAAAG
jgi:hypothetical protein